LAAEELETEAEAIQSPPLRAFSAVISGMNAAGSCWIVLLMLLINAEAISRSAFNQPIIGVIEMIEISVIGIVFLQLADSLRRGVFIRSDGVAHVMAISTYTLGAIFMALILWGCIPYFLSAWTNDWYVGVEGMFTAPKWPIVLIVNIAIFMTMIQFLIMSGAHCRQLITRK
jgi:TRAP-type C4-dicarboxylate transport system permease small subunit